MCPVRGEAETAGFMKKKTILVVDDEDIIVEYAVTVLLGTGRYVAIGVTRADQALRVVRERPVDLIISDIRMPEMDGFDLVRIVRRERPSVQIIFMTGYDVPEARVEASGLGSVAFLQKPVKAQRLIAAVNESLQLAEEEQRVPLRPIGPNGKSPVVSLQGRLENFPLGEILQMCCMARRTGRIVVLRDDDRGELFIEKGRIVHAVYGSESGPAAFFELYRWDRGAFAFEDGVIGHHRTITADWEHLLLEASRSKDERLPAGA